jgi:hypothetical protein
MWGRLSHTLQNPDRQQGRNALVSLDGKPNRPTAVRRNKLNRQAGRGVGRAGRVFHAGHAIRARSGRAGSKPLDYGLGEAGPHVFHWKLPFHYILKNITMTPKVKHGKRFILVAVCPRIEVCRLVAARRGRLDKSQRQPAATMQCGLARRRPRTA